MGWRGLNPSSQEQYRPKCRAHVNIVMKFKIIHTMYSTLRLSLMVMKLRFHKIRRGFFLPISYSRRILLPDVIYFDVFN